MKFWLGVTDTSWYDFLSAAAVDEVNFWQPGGRKPFNDLQPGSPFLFKLKRPHNHIGGGGWFVKSTSLPLSIAWEAFGNKNGAATRTQFEAMIRPLLPDPRARDPEIGCTILAEPFFWPREHWIPEPVNFSRYIMTGRCYDTAVPLEAQLWEQVRQRNAGLQPAMAAAREPSAAERYGTPILTQPRLGQGAFRALVTDAYQRRCALTGESTLPVLDAAHILPYAEQGPHEVANGLLLRSDFHKLFDLGMVTITPEYRIEVSSRIREEWCNGKAYYRLHGQPLAVLPEALHERPDRAHLRWHNEHRYQSR